MSARCVLSFSRDLEFAPETELAKRMGCQRHYWLRATLKELIDNGLDACEEAGIEPSIIISVVGNQLMVGDNGPGLPPELVERLCIRSERTSAREAYAAPDRGSQGNALPTLMALPFGFGLDEAGLVITSHGIEHTITLRVNRLEQRIDLERTTREVTTAPGAIVTLTWPMEIDLEKVEALIDQHAWLNPHAEFQLNEDRWERTEAVTKWPAAAPILPQWYTFERLTHRVLLEIKRDPKITVAQFLGSFRGLASTVKRKEVAAAVNLSYQPLTALLDASGTALDQHHAYAMFNAMKDASRPPKPAVLGAVDKETFEAWARNHGR